MGNIYNDDNLMMTSRTENRRRKREGVERCLAEVSDRAGVSGTDSVQPLHPGEHRLRRQRRSRDSRSGRQGRDNG